MSTGAKSLRATGAANDLRGKTDATQKMRV